MTVIKKCTCKHDFQDKEYGLGMRLCNVKIKVGTKSDGCKCTVCGTIHKDEIKKK